MIIKPYSSMHFYERDGSFAKGAGLGEARKRGLFPSVTTISGIIRLPAIDAWRNNLLLNVAWDELIRCVGLRDPDEIEWKKTVTDEWRRGQSKASGLGTDVHGSIEDFLRDGRRPNPHGTDLILSTIDQIEAWMEENVVKIDGIEDSFAHPMGFGGRTDLHGTWGVRQRPFTLDWKTQGKPIDDISFWDDWPVQLSANAAGQGKLDGDLISAAISTVEPYGVTFREPWGDNLYWFGRFNNRFDVWKDEKKFDPLDWSPA